MLSDYELFVKIYKIRQNLFRRLTKNNIEYVNIETGINKDVFQLNKKFPVTKIKFYLNLISVDYIRVSKDCEIMQVNKNHIENLSISKNVSRLFEFIIK